MYLLELEKEFTEEAPEYQNGLKVAGVYLIKHPVTDRMYIGSSHNLYSRINRHRSLLKLKKHPNKELQLVFDFVPEVVVTVKKLDSVEDAINKEQELLTKFQKNPRVVNVAIDARNSFQGLKHTRTSKLKMSIAQTGHHMSLEAIEKIRQAMTGRPVSFETREKLSKVKTGIPRPEHINVILREANEAKAVPVIIEDSLYLSVSQAARAFSVDPKTVYNRISSKTDRFKHWKFQDKQ